MGGKKRINIMKSLKLSNIVHEMFIRQVVSRMAGVMD